MSVADHIWREPAKRNRSRETDFRALVALGATGAITAGQTFFGFTITKTAAKTGRYDIQMTDSKGNAIVLPSATALVLLGAVVQTATADAAYTTAKAAYGIVRNNNVTTTGAFQIQMVRTDTAADAEVEDNGKIHLSFSCKFSSVNP